MEHGHVGLLDHLGRPDPLEAEQQVGGDGGLVNSPSSRGSSSSNPANCR